MTEEVGEGMKLDDSSSAAADDGVRYELLGVLVGL